jgi:simple sugar transport system permease protein
VTLLPRQIQRVPENAILALMLALAFGLMSVLNPSHFLSPANLQSMAFQLPELGLLALAMMLPLLTGGINLAIIAISNLAGITTALTLLALVPDPASSSIAVLATIAALIAGLATATAAGSAAGLLIARFEVAPILATLGLMLFLEGFNLVLTQGRALSGLPNTLHFLGNETLAGIPVPLLLFLGSTLAISLFLNRTPAGRSLYLLGANPVATRFSGIHNPRLLLITYLISGLLAGLAGLIMISRFNSAKAGYGQSYLLVTLLAAVLGGTRATGGFGRVSGLLLALLTLQTVASGLNLLRVNAHFTNALWGAILLVTMALNRYTRAHRKPD